MDGQGANQVVTCSSFVAGDVQLQFTNTRNNQYAVYNHRYLYCHQKHSTRDDFKGKNKIYDNQFEYIRSNRYPTNMQVRQCEEDAFRSKALLWLLIHIVPVLS